MLGEQFDSLLDRYEDMQMQMAMQMSLAENPDASLDLSYESLVDLEDVKRTATPEQVSKMKRHVYKAKTGQAAATGKCLICQSEYEDRDAQIELPCGHRFHSDCGSQWLSEYSRNCPVCKADAAEAAGAGKDKSAT
ncbi:unnamed protein product [Pedinophyceae sp. YPF-701]|nr:unnamed protein product [Pedinophyceae sp. YPF-701]